MKYRHTKEIYTLYPHGFYCDLVEELKKSESFAEAKRLLMILAKKNNWPFKEVNYSEEYEENGYYKTINFDWDITKIGGISYTNYPWCGLSKGAKPVTVFELIEIFDTPYTVIMPTAYMKFNSHSICFYDNHIEMNGIVLTKDEIKKIAEQLGMMVKAE